MRSEGLALLLMLVALAGCDGRRQGTRGEEGEPYAVLNNGPAESTPLPFPDAAAPPAAADPPDGGNAGTPYRYCSEARTAGAAPLRRGDPGYAPHLDRDGDGVACEPYRGRRSGF